MSWLDPGRYSFPVVVSLLLHVLVAGLFIVQWPTEHRVPEPVPQHVVASVVQSENQAVKERREKALREQRKKEQAAARKKKLAEKKRQEKEKAQKLAAQKKREQEKALKEKALAEKKASEKAARDKAEKDRQAKERAQQETQLLEQLAKEQAEAEARAQAEAEAWAEKVAEITSGSVSDIRSRIESVWRYPPAVRPEQETEVSITLVPTGQVINVKITRSSGNAALDRSVEQAIFKASPLPVPKDPRVFEKSFRNLTMKFRPENATW